MANITEETDSMEQLLKSMEAKDEVTEHPSCTLDDSEECLSCGS